MTTILQKIKAANNKSKCNGFIVSLILLGCKKYEPDIDVNQIPYVLIYKDTFKLLVYAKNTIISIYNRTNSIAFYTNNKTITLPNDIKQIKRYLDLKYKQIT